MTKKAMTRDEAEKLAKTVFSCDEDGNFHCASGDIAALILRIAAEQFNAGVEASAEKVNEAAESFGRLADDARTSELMNRWESVSESLQGVRNQVAALKAEVPK